MKLLSITFTPISNYLHILRGNRNQFALVELSCARSLDLLLGILYLFYLDEHILLHVEKDLSDNLPDSQPI
jgi:hypothetical protein